MRRNITANDMSWKFHTDGYERHVWPQDDERKHVLEGADCWCNPTSGEIYGTIQIVHNSHDQRELIEQAESIKECTSKIIEP